MNVRFLRHATPALVLGLALLAFAPTASAQDPMDLHLSGFFALGAGGEAKADEDADGAELDPTVGFGVRVDVPILEYFTVGGQIGFNFWKLDGADDRQTWIDLPVLVLRGRYPVRVGSGLLEPYVGFLIGGTISILDIPVLDENDTAYGWNVGLVFGAQYFFTDVIGAMFEIGWHRHAAEHEYEVGGITIAGDYWTNQVAINFGISVLF